MIEFGCGDGNQLALADYPALHRGSTSVSEPSSCVRARFRDDPTKTFGLLRDYRGERAELSLSLDVIFHLIEDHVFDAHLRTVFAAAERFVIVYSSNTDSRRLLQRAHVRHRMFTDWVDEHARGLGAAPRGAQPGSSPTGEHSAPASTSFARGAGERARRASRA